MTPLASQVVDSAQSSLGFLFKYISANDTGATGAHQSGPYMPRDTWPLFFDRPGERGENREIPVTLHWPEGPVASRFVWYGRAKSKSEYRLTRGWRFLEDRNVGDVMVLARRAPGHFDAFLVSADEDIDDFLAALSLSPSDAGRVQRANQDRAPALERFGGEWLSALPDLPGGEFPPAATLSAKAREFRRLHSGPPDFQQVDQVLLDWLDIEFELFKQLEAERYGHFTLQPFGSVQSLMDAANTILNRRKARSGLALENHLRHIFTTLGVSFAHQEITEGRSRPDFLFPSILHYRDGSFPEDRLVSLAVKTTCKDRWRQVLNEAARIRRKHLFTLQQGISAAQLDEMERADVQLVVPEPYRRFFPRRHADRLLSLSQFLDRLDSIML